MRVGDRTERWIVAQGAEGIAQQQAPLQHRAEQDRQLWTKRLRELEQRPFACEADALIACSQTEKSLPSWLEVALHLEVSVQPPGRGRPCTGPPTEAQVWAVHGTVRVNEVAVQAEVARKAKFIVATNVSASRRAAEEVIRLYKAQSGVERGFAFRNRSVVPRVLCVYQENRARDGDRARDGTLPPRLPLAEYRIHQRLAETGATVPDQLKNPTQRPTLRWLFQCFEDISLVLRVGEPPASVEVTGLTDLHGLVLKLLRPLYQKIYA